MHPRAPVVRLVIFLYQILSHKPKFTCDWSLTLALPQIVGSNKNLGSIWTKYILDPKFIGHNLFEPKIFLFKNGKFFWRFFSIVIFSISVTPNFLCLQFVNTQIFFEAKDFDPKILVKKSDQVDNVTIEYFDSISNRKTWNLSVALLSLTCFDTFPKSNSACNFWCQK